MGRDKALLPLGSQTLVDRVAQAVRAAAGSVTLIGDPEKYGALGYPVAPDRIAGCGPLGGIYSALCGSPSEWNLILACDMPGIATEFLSELLERAEQSGADAFLAAGPAGRPEPLCAVYHRRCAGVIGRALENNVRKVLDGLRGLELQAWQVPEARWLQNLNTPQEWSSYTSSL